MLALAIITLGLLSPDDGAMVVGGAPRLMKGHSAIRLVAERVYVRVDDRYQSVDCWFAFKNDGPKCTVTMGFPDFGYGSYETQHNEDVDEAKRKRRKRPVFHGIERFKSWVDDKEVSLKRVSESDAAVGWFTKKVTFAKNGWRRVRVSYINELGSGFTNSGGHISEAGYVLHTGASWKGAIGSVIVVFDFKGNHPLPIRLKPVPDILQSAYESRNWRLVPKTTMMYSAFSNPKVVGRTVTFRAKNLEPDEDDDVRICFGFRKWDG